MFPANVVYRQSFDDGSLVPDIGRVERPQDPKTCEFAEGGVFGKCLAAGSVRFDRDADGEPFMNTISSGTVICWVRYVMDPPQGERTGFEFLLADVDAPAGQRGRLMMLKLRDCGLAGLYEYFEGSKRQAKSVITTISYARSWQNPWPKGEWRMFAMTWGGGWLSISQNGADFQTCVLDRRLLPLKYGCELRAPGIRGKDRFYQLDEFTILNRALTKDELHRLYEETMKCRNMQRF